MSQTTFNRDPQRLRRLWPPLAVVILALLSWGCQGKEPPLSPGATAFKKEINECVRKLAAPLTGPVSAKDKAAISAALALVEPEAIKLCRMCPFEIGVLNPQGDILATHPATAHGTRSFADYDLLSKTINTKQTQQQRFYLQDSQQLYIVSAPLIEKDRVIGMLAIAISAGEAKARWGLTANEFLTLNFNN